MKKAGKAVDISKFSAGLEDGSPYVVEHIDFLRSVFGIGQYFNEAEQVTMSTASGVIANISAKSGQSVYMDDIISNVSSPFYSMQLKPSAVDFERDGDVEPPEYGDDEFPIPGKVALPRLRNPDDDEWMPQRQ